MWIFYHETGGRKTAKSIFFKGEPLCISISSSVYLVSFFIDFRLSEMDRNFKTLLILQETEESIR